MTPLTADQLDRARGAIVASAAADALGAPYEFSGPFDDDWTPAFGPGAMGHGEGEWTDDTAMAVPILEWAAARGALDRRHTIERWLEWRLVTPDIGHQTRTVLRGLSPASADLERDARDAAKAFHDRNAERSAGNGSLMRAAPLALLGLAEGTVDTEAIEAITRFTHWEDDNVIACTLWVQAMQQAILTGGFSMPELLDALDLPAEAHERWSERLRMALRSDAHPRHYRHDNGWVVSAFCAALAAVTHTDTLEDAVHAAIRGGEDTDTVAAITGALAGAVHGLQAVPAEWIETIHGWPGCTAHDLIRLTDEALGVVDTDRDA